MTLSNGVIYLDYLSQQFLERLPNTHQPNVVKEVSHKPGIQQVENGWRTGKEKQEGGRRKRKRRRRRRGGRRRRKRRRGRWEGRREEREKEREWEEDEKE